MDRAGRATSPVATSVRPRRRIQTWLFALAFVALVSGTVAGFLLARDRAERTADRRAEQAAARVAESLETELRELVAGLAGAGAIVGSDGRLDQNVFAAFAADLIEAEGIHGLTLVDVVAAEDRADYEERAGRPIAVAEGGALVAAPPSRVHFPVSAVEPQSPGRSEVGLDFGSDPDRGATLRSAVRTGAPTVSEVVNLPSGEPGLELVRPLAGGPGEVPTAAGLVVAGVTVDELAATAQEVMATGAEVAVADGETVIFGPEFDPRLETTSASAQVPGRAWTVVVGPAGKADLTPAWLVAAGGLAAIIAMGALMIATERHQRRLARANGLLIRSEERSRAVQDVAGRLARALSGGEIVTALVDHLPAAVGAQSVVLATVNEAGRLEVLGPDDTTSAHSLFLEDDDATSLVRTAMTQREPAWLSSPLAWRGDEATATVARGGSALALLPLVAENVTGVLAVAYPRIRIFAEDEQALLQTVSILAARALARGRRYDSEHHAALAFQHAALPDDLPAVDGLTFAARYRPAARQATVGGDWYDVLVLDDRRVVLVVGDVVGHGMVAAAAMGRLRTAFQAIAPLSADPGAMLRALSNQVSSIPDSFCTTVVCAVVDLETGSMTWCRAGHPPPLALGRGDAYLLDEPGLPPLGVAPDEEPPVHTRALDPGDIIILYTDGIIERRGESIDEGFERLAIVAETLADLEPGDFSDALVEALVPADEQADDLAVLVFRFDGIASGGVEGCQPPTSLSRSSSKSSLLT